VNAAADKSGIMLLCDSSGTIERVIRDDLGIVADWHPGTNFCELVDAESQEKARAFLSAARAGNATFGWELNVPCDGELMGLLLGGGLANDAIIVCGTPSRSGENQYFDAMASIQNSQLNALRIALKAEQLETANRQQREQESLNEFTRLNNELVNTQRELARRNADLLDANTQLAALATTDGLTGVKNHRAFQEALASEWSRATRYGTPLSMLMLDVDHFKQFNDQFGHPAGDSVLKQVAHILTRESRSDSIVARYGGEEFVVVLPSCDRLAAAEIAERVRRAVAVESWDLRPITVSIGAATRSEATPDRASLIARADAAMYLAKAGGRNKVATDSEVQATAAGLDDLADLVAL